MTSLSEALELLEVEELDTEEILSLSIELEEQL
jgi:hypothetical protein